MLAQRIEELLEQNPEGQAATLHELQIELGTLREDSSSETLEKAFQSLGTAVGKHSKI